jgi:hypothetical protein
MELLIATVSPEINREILEKNFEGRKIKICHKIFHRIILLSREAPNNLIIEN